MSHPISLIRKQDLVASPTRRSYEQTGFAVVSRPISLIRKRISFSVPSVGLNIKQDLL